MKHLYLLLLTFCSCYLPATEDPLKKIVERTFVENKEMNEMFYMIATKKIADSGKAIDPESLMKSLKDEMIKPEHFKAFEKPYREQFQAKEFAEILELVENPVFEKFSSATPMIIKESIKELDKILDALIAKEAAAAAPITAAILEVNAENFDAEVINSKQPVVLDFYATWCVPCKGMQAILLTLGQKYGTQIKFAKIDFDRAKAIAEQFKIKDLPTVLFIKDGRVADIQSGFAEMQIIEDKIKTALLNSN